uniref:cytochrome c oxidase subunit 3 n=1 Tax=Dactylogyrus simplex TaxID=2736736 RepID=UPI002E7A183B|nr:cytochrome c oxidase subunit 3 [Dactylogyrus simplex]WPS93113.1 cytochrome c oxidase subunit 3 [Dactylogyrus simplex]
MSWLPVFNAFSTFLFLVSAILWNLKGLQVFLLLAAFSALFLWLETAKGVTLHYLDSFWMFILSEVIVFISLLTCCLWFEDSSDINLSPYLEIPFFGCFLLIGSSVTATGFHHSAGTRSGDVHLLATLILGAGFVWLQLIEFGECPVSIVSSVYHASCFCTVGLHFSHVLIGLIFLAVLFIAGSDVFGDYYTTLFVWYWHFVDYVWLFVYTVVYLC